MGRGYRPNIPLECVSDSKKIIRIATIPLQDLLCETTCIVYWNRPFLPMGFMPDPQKHFGRQLKYFVEICLIQGEYFMVNYHAYQLCHTSNS